MDLTKMLRGGVKKYLLLASVALLFSACGGGGSATTASGGTATTVTAVDGYIKNAVLKDASGKIGLYDKDGKYLFSDTPVYPLTLSGGVLEDTNVSFDINLTASSGDVISPITTLIYNNTTIENRLKTIMGVDLRGDYIEGNNTDLAKLSQLCYALLKDNNLAGTFKSELENNTSIDTLDKLFDLATSSFDKADMDINLRGNLKAMIPAIKDINSSVIGANELEDELKTYKIIVSNHYKDPSFLATLKTGQTTSYYANDDGDLQRGEARSYTRDDAKEVVVDNVTNLMWQDNNDSKTVTKNWSDAVNYCEELSLGGYSDWRLPSIDELMSITDKERYSSSIDSTFQNVVSDDYWSSTTGASYTSVAWLVYFNGGYDNWYNKSYTYYVRCVRDNN